MTEGLFSLWGIPLEPGSRADMRIFLTAKKGQAQLVTLNPEFLLEARRNERFARVLRDAVFRTIDGVGLQFAALLWGRWLPRYTGVDIVEHLCEWAEKEGKGVYFLGGARGVAQKAADAMRKRYPELMIYSDSGAENVREEREPSRQKVIARITESDATLLFVAYGAPWQDVWIADNLSHLPSVRLAVGVGGTFDYVAGNARRAPGWVRKMGLEWLVRLMFSPRRARRIARALISFPLLVLKERVRTFPSSSPRV